MPITTRYSMKHMAALSLGTRVPAGLLAAIHHVPDEKVCNVGIHWAAQQVFDLLAYDVDGIHFYTMNRCRSTIEIYKNLCLVNSNPLPE